MSDVKETAQKQAEEAYDIFFKFMKGFGWVCRFIMFALVSCNFGVDGTGSKSDPELYEEYKERMLEMQEEIKKKKYGG